MKQDRAIAVVVLLITKMAWLGGTIVDLSWMPGTLRVQSFSCHVRQAQFEKTLYIKPKYCFTKYH